MPDTILIALDGSDFSERALPVGLDLAKTYANSVQLLLAVNHERDFQAGSDYLRLKTQEATNLNLECRFTVLVGDASEQIIEASKSARTLVMASHGRSAFDRLVLGSVATKVTRGSHCPVLLVREHPVRLKEIKKVMVPLDGFELSKTALPEAERFCKAFGATLVLTRVSEPIGFEFGLLDREEEGARLQEFLKEVATSVDPYITVETAHGFGSAARVLLQQISELEIDLLLLSSHGRSGFNRLVCGSVTENVVRGADCPVFVVRPA